MKGRPTLFTQELFDAICSQIANGITLSEICRGEGMPDRTTVYLWMKDNDELTQQFARGREIGYDVIAEDVLDIIDDGSNDYMKRIGADGSEQWVLNGEHIQRSKIRAEYRLKLLAKWSPKKYGDKLELGGNLNLTNEPITFE